VRLLEPVALELAAMTSPSEVASPSGPGQLERVLDVIVREAPPPQVSAVFVHLEDAYSVLMFRDVLAKQASERASAIKEEIRKRDAKGARSMLFLSWIRDIGGIETA
jgi:hypothetical protein